jgi:hypothetical protein
MCSRYSSSVMTIMWKIGRKSITQPSAYQDGQSQAKPTVERKYYPDPNLLNPPFPGMGDMINRCFWAAHRPKTPYFVSPSTNLGEGLIWVTIGS